MSEHMSLSLDTARNGLLWAPKELDVAPHQVDGPVLQVGDAEKFPHANLVSKVRIKYKRPNQQLQEHDDAFSLLLQYLHDTLGDFVRTLVESEDDCEVDPTKVSNNATLQCHQTSLEMYATMAWVKIINSYCYFPK